MEVTPVIFPTANRSSIVSPIAGKTLTTNQKKWESGSVEMSMRRLGFAFIHGAWRLSLVGEKLLQVSVDVFVGCGDVGIIP